MNGTTVAGFWESFRERVMSPECPPDQVREMRLAFYGGATAMQELVALIGDAAISEDRGMEILEAISLELRDFAREMKAMKPIVTDLVTPAHPPPA